MVTNVLCFFKYLAVGFLLDLRKRTFYSLTLAVIYIYVTLHYGIHLKEGCFFCRNILIFSVRTDIYSTSTGTF